MKHFLNSMTSAARSVARQPTTSGAGNLQNCHPAMQNVKLRDLKCVFGGGPHGVWDPSAIAQQVAL